MVSHAGADPQWPRVSVVVPTLNEEKNLPYVFSRLPANVHEVIVVDGHSVDDTIAVARQLRPDVLVVQQTRTGKGNALACGFAAATGDIIAMVDADGSADPSEIPKFVHALLAAQTSQREQGSPQAAAAVTSRGCAGSVTACSVQWSISAMERTTQISVTGSTCSGRSTSQFWALTSPLLLRPGATGGCGAMASRSRR